MGTPKVPDPIKPPAAPDTTKAWLNALAYAETEKKLRATSGRRGTFLGSAASGSLLGQ